MEKHINAKDLCAYALAAVGGGYVYGASGQTCSLAVRQSCAAANPSQKENILGICQKWDGKPVWDCSGIFRGAWRALWQYRSGGATTIYNTWCAEKGEIGTMPDIAGVLVFRGTDAAKQHVGLYVGGGMVVDARGSSQGVLHGPLSGYPWTHWAVADDVDMASALPSPGETPALWHGSVKTRTGGGISLWRNSAKKTALLKVAEGAAVDVLADADERGFAQARVGLVCGMADLQYIVPEDGEAPEQTTYAATVVGVSKGLNLRTSPDMGTNTLLLIPPGRTVEVFPRMASGAFAYVTYAGKTGYCTATKLAPVVGEAA